jgi:hypothetical protein
VSEFFTIWNASIYHRNHRLLLAIVITAGIPRGFAAGKVSGFFTTIDYTGSNLSAKSLKSIITIFLARFLRASPQNTERAVRGLGRAIVMNTDFGETIVGIAPAARRRLRSLALTFAALGFLALASTLSLLSGRALAAPVLDFLPGPVGTAGIEYTGGATAVQTKATSPVPIVTISGSGTPLAQPDLAVTNGTLVFQTGPLSTFSSNVSSSLWSFIPGGSIQVVGGIPGLGIPDGTTLLSGSFGPANVSGDAGTLPLNGLLSATFTDVKHNDLLTYYGIPANTLFAGQLAVSARLVPPPPPQSPPAFSSTGVTSVNLINTVSVSVPEPGSLALLAVGLAGLGFMRRRRVA